MRNAAFTIVAKNYFGLAEILGNSIRKYNPEIDFHIFIADENNNETISEKLNESKFSYHFCKDVLEIDEVSWYNNAFKYSVTEFCTYLKPYSFSYLFKEDYEKVIYFDPDILVFDSLNEIITELEDNIAVLTPHITTIQEFYSGDSTEADILSSGIYNLGFLGLRNSDNAQMIVKWWANRLQDMCFVDKAAGLFTDQKWIDFIQSFFDGGILVSRDLGRNIAPWNFYERKVYEAEGKFRVVNRINNKSDTKLTFVHFSGFNYKQLRDSNLNHPNIDFSKYGDIDLLFKVYEQEIGQGRIIEFLDQSYTYNYFDNQKEILHLYRRFYRRILLKKDYNFSNPFKSESENSYFNALSKRQLVDEESKSSTKVDKLNKSDIEGFYKKVKILNKIFYNLKRMLGFKKYYLLTRFFVKYFKTENQLFLLDPNDVIKPN